MLALGPKSFVNSLNEIKSNLKFNILNYPTNGPKTKFDADVLLFHHQSLSDKQEKEKIKNSNLIKVLASTEKLIGNNSFDLYVKLPTSVVELNLLVENAVAKKKFSKNSSIKIKKYQLDKNEKKLFKEDKYVILTEKEIKLLELFLMNSKPVTKDYILEQVWNYSSEADTHTVETHIYRLRKKINEKFGDDNFISINKEGYFL